MATEYNGKHFSERDGGLVRPTPQPAMRSVSSEFATSNGRARAFDDSHREAQPHSVWPPPPNLELPSHASPDKFALTPDAAFRFFAGKFIEYGVGLGAAYGGVLGFFAFIVGIIFGIPIGAVLGLILGIPEGIVLGLLAAHLAKKGYCAIEIGRRTCAAAPVAAAVLGALMIASYYEVTQKPFGNILQNWFTLIYVIAIFAAYHAGILASQKFADKYA